MRATTACAVGAVNGGAPASISYRTAASAYTSLRASRRRSPAACSGLMYSAVPGAKPVPVSESCPGSARASRSFATPKSVTSACPRESRMFAGFTSRWITPLSCAYWSASATWTAIPTASPTGSGPSRASRSRSDSPSTYSIA